jgi:hypothetical protein
VLTVAAAHVATAVVVAGPDAGQSVVSAAAGYSVGSCTSRI